MARMIQIADLITELQQIQERWGNTCVYIRDMSWGSVALNREFDDRRKAEPVNSFCPKCRTECFSFANRSGCCDEPTGGDGAKGGDS